jgi:aldose sugar dehydrogenase
MRRILLGVTAVLGAGALTLTFLPSTSASPSPHRDAAATKAAAATYPALSITRLASGLDLPWDVKPIPGGKLLITERARKRLLLWTPRHHARPVKFPAATVWSSGETGLMGLAVDPKFKQNKRFYTCQGGKPTRNRHDVRVLAWQLQKNRAKLVRKLLTGLPSTSGRHGGCRLLIARNGYLMVGTGDAATGTNPRNLNSLGGKTLRLNRFTGAPSKLNPFIHSANRNRRYVVTFGHRNVQGLAQRYDGTLWSAEHGPDRDDEINLLAGGGDYGWNPVPGYNEGVPMTNQALDGTQRNARWSSGSPTLATSGIAWVHGTQWKSYRGALAVAALKASRLMFMRFDTNGHFVSVRTPAALKRYGRLRSVTSLGNGDLLVTTSNGNGHDLLLRVRPRG